jgi:hypothetical protein
MMQLLMMRDLKKLTFLHHFGAQRFSPNYTKILGKDIHRSDLRDDANSGD